jgi:hypothetical protein
LYIQNDHSYRHSYKKGHLYKKRKVGRERGKEGKRVRGEAKREGRGGKVSGRKM